MSQEEKTGKNKAFGAESSNGVRQYTSEEEISEAVGAKP